MEEYNFMASRKKIGIKMKATLIWCPAIVMLMCAITL